MMRTKSPREKKSRHANGKGLLQKIESPRDIRTLPVEKLPRLAAEIRELMIDGISRRGGHLASSLGAVDLTVALHYAFDTPTDAIVWDVGHQAYAHKIITGRRTLFSSIREWGGISGFPRCDESEYDTASVGHASTSISCGLGMAVARDILKKKYNVIAVIGDGSLSGGLAFEGLNNLGSLSTNMTVVLNDNEMSISRNVGALSRYLTRLLTDRRYNKIKTDIWELLGYLSHIGKSIRNLVHNVDDALKHFVIPGKLFEDMGLRYFGPVDGHNIAELVEVFRFVRDASSGPMLVHVVTKKGKGYRFAEKDATKYHGIGTFSRQTGTVSPKSGTAPSYSAVFGGALTEFGARFTDVVAITAAMPDGTGLTRFRNAFPDRFFDVGIAEGHAVTFAAGLARRGLRPVVAIYSTFLQRAYDQIIHDIALDGLDVVFCIDRAGIVGEDGPTHHGAFDLSYLRTVPGTVIMAPSDENELRNMLYTALSGRHGPLFIRYPRGTGRGVELDRRPAAYPIGKPLPVRRGKSCAIIAAGTILANVMDALPILEKSGITPTVVDARFVKPLDPPFYTDLLARHRYIVTVESNALSGGFGSALMELACASTTPSRSTAPRKRFLALGYPDRFVPHGAITRLEQELGLDPEGIARKIAEFVIPKK